MKSPLVDALRQASNAATPDRTEDKPRDSGAPSSSPSTATANSKSLELDLLETGRYEVAANSLSEDAPVAKANTVADATLPEPGFVDAGASELSELEIPASKRVSVSDQKAIVARIGQFSPILCVLALASSAGAYLFLNNISVMDSNGNLSEYSARGQPKSGQETGDDHEVTLPLTGVSVFEQRDAAPVVKPVVDEQAAQPRGEKAHVDPIRVPVPVEARSLSSAISPSGRAAVRDDAFASVMSAYEAYRRRDFGAAEKYYMAALEIEPNHRDGLAGMAAVYLQTDRTERAIAAYERLLAIEPRNPAAAAAILAIRSDDTNWEIESELKLLLQRFPDSHHLHNALGSLYVGQQKWPDAKYEFLSAHRLAPEIADYSYNTAVSMDRMGQQAAAQDYYKLALKSANEHSGFDRSAILAHLDELEQQQRERL